MKMIMISGVSAECFLSMRDSGVCVFMCALSLERMFAPVTGADGC